MTHADIFKKFMIEYDKANITSSYPSLTDYEIATILDKAYLALIALKVTGTNFRKAGLEVDTKAIEDILQLITRADVNRLIVNNVAANEYVFNTPTEFLYFVSGDIQIKGSDRIPHTYCTNLVSHDIANKYKVTSNNLPWINDPVVYIENNKFHVLIDAYKYPNGGSITYNVQYIKEPSKFVDDYTSKTSTFELNDSMAEELINLAIIMSLEVVESSRLDNKIKTSSLES